MKLSSKPQINHFNWQTGKLGKPFRLTAIQKGTDEKWIGNVLKSDWYYIFKYEDGSLFSLHEDLNGKIFEKLNHKETNNLLCN